MNSLFRVFSLVVALLVCCNVNAESIFDQLRDDDGWIDVSDYVLENSSGFMPVPIMITEPAVGAGLGVAALFFHPPKDYVSDATEQDEFVVPNITAVAAGGTENGTWFVGGGHIAHWKNDSIRYEGVLGFANVNVKFYGVEGATNYADGLNFTGEALFVQQPISFRMGGSNFFLGGEWEFMAMETQFDLGTGIPEIDDLTIDAQLSGLKVFLNYETLDNTFTPNEGIEAEVGLTRRDKAIGSDFEFDEFEAKLHVFRKLGSRFVLGARLDVDSVDGDVPFFSVPSIDMRGIPALRYQGDSVVVAELEGRWAIHSRFSAVGYIGAGRAASSWGKLGDAPSRTTRGIGLRYFIARKLGMHIGLDVARGPEDTHYYMAFGSAWD
jgi:hypothetical protein